VPLVADRAGVGAGTLYRYFDSKEAMVNALFQKWKQELGLKLLSDFPLDAPVREQFHHIWSRMLGFATENPKAFVFLELHHHSYLDQESRELELAVLGPAREFIGAAQKKGALKRVPAEVLMAIVYGALLGLARAAEHGYLDLETGAARAEGCVWEAIRR
jgi:AcrR family transcriptional regulator